MVPMMACVFPQSFSRSQELISILAAFVVAVAALFGPEFWDCGITSY